MTSFVELFKANLKILYRDGNSLAWNILIPVVIYTVLAAFARKYTIAQFNYGNFLLPGVLAYVIMQGGIYGLAYWLVDLRSRGVLKRFLVTPLSTTKLITGVICSRLIVLFLQVSIISLIGGFVFHTPFFNNFLSIILLVIIGGTIFLLLGLIISSMAGSYQSASPITAAIGLPLMALGNIFVPLSLFPKVIQTIGHLLPVTYLANGLRQAYLYPFNASALAKSFAGLLIWFIIMLLLTVAFFRLKED